MLEVNRSGGNGGGKGDGKSDSKKHRKHTSTHAFHFLNVTKNGTFRLSLEKLIGDSFTTNPAFFDAIDEMVPAHCLCCYEADSVCIAKHVDENLKMMMKYFKHESYLESAASNRIRESVNRDATPHEISAAASHARDISKRVMCGAAGGAAGGAASEESERISFIKTVTHKLSRLEGIAAAYSMCEDFGKSCLGAAFWLIYSPEARKFARKLSKAAVKSGLQMSTHSAPPTAACRFKFRRQMIEFYNCSHLAAWELIETVAKNSRRELKSQLCAAPSAQRHVRKPPKVP